MKPKTVLLTVAVTLLTFAPVVLLAGHGCGHSGGHGCLPHKWHHHPGPPHHGGHHGGHHHRDCSEGWFYGLQIAELATDVLRIITTPPPPPAPVVVAPPAVQPQVVVTQPPRPAPVVIYPR